MLDMAEIINCPPKNLCSIFQIIELSLTNVCQGKDTLPNPTYIYVGPSTNSHQWNVNRSYAYLFQDNFFKKSVQQLKDEIYGIFI